MATKKISDLSLRSDFDATCILPVDDASQTWRVTGEQLKDFLLAAATLGEKVTELTAKTALVAADELLIYDTVGTTGKKVTLSNLHKKIIRSASSTDSVLATDDVLIYSGASFTATLPAASGLSGKILQFKHNDSTLGRVYTIDGNASETIDGVTTKKISTIGEVLTLICDGSNWHILERRINSVWTAFTPTGAWVTNTTYTGFWKRVGDTIKLQYKLATSGAPTSANLTLDIPSGLTIDTAKLAQSSSQLHYAGLGNVQDGGASQYPVLVRHSGTNLLDVVVVDDGANGLVLANFVTQAVPITFGNTDSVNVSAEIPITDWEG